MSPLKYDERFVIRVNEIYHDLEAETYAQRHPEIFVDEVERWKRITTEYLVRPAQANRHPPKHQTRAGGGTGRNGSRYA